MVYITRYVISEGKILEGELVETWNIENDLTKKKSRAYIVKSGDRKFILNEEDFSYSFEGAVLKAEAMRLKEIKKLEKELTQLRNISYRKAQ